MPKIRLRCLQPEDAPALHFWMNDPETVKYLGSGFERGYTMEQVNELIQMQRDGEFTTQRYAIADALSDEYLGECCLLLPDEKVRKAELALVLMPRARGKGVAQEALRQLLRTAFEQLNYQRIYLKCAASNLKAVKLYEKAGLVKEGILRRDMLVDGMPEDVYVYSVLKEEYARLIETQTQIPQSAHTVFDVSNTNRE